MSPITSLRTPQFSTLPQVARQVTTRLNHGTDSVLFGHGHKSDTPHTHEDGTPCNGHHGDHEKPEAHKLKKKHTEKSDKAAPEKESFLKRVKTWFKNSSTSSPNSHTHEDGTVCTHKHDHPHDSASTDNAGWFRKTYNGTKTWFKNFFETIKEDWNALIAKIKSIFSGKTKPDP